MSLSISTPLPPINIDEDESEVIPFESTQPESTQPEPKPARTLDSFAVSHGDTLGMSWKEIDALRPPFVIDQFIRRGELMLLGAESKSRKSWLAQDAGFSVACGTPWLADEDGNHGLATAKACVHVIDLELNPSEMRFRFAKARGNRFQHDAQAAQEVTARFFSYSLDGLNVKDVLPHIEQLRAKAQPGDLVIVDCFYRLVPDGNEAHDVAIMLETLKRFTAETKCGMILVDHFRKAGDEKARNRFAGSFVKQASASTLVAIEVTGDTLVMSIDARTFHGLPQVYAKFNLDTYAFNRVPEEEIAAAKASKKQAEMDSYIIQIWKSRALDYAAPYAVAEMAWGISRQGCTARFKKLEEAELIRKIPPTTKGGANSFALTELGKEVLVDALKLHPLVAPHEKSLLSTRKTQGANELHP